VKKAKVKGGDTIQVTLELDTAPREVDVPADLAAALEKAGARPGSTRAYSYHKEHVRSIEDAKASETRQRRIAKAVAQALER
jgi:uncharacterized protein YdeI (YjbR/CyaY-like superfamily)